MSLSKSNLIAYLQCPRRLWLEVHRPDLRRLSSSSQLPFLAGRQVGEVARRLYDPDLKGQLVDISEEGIDAAIIRTRQLLPGRRPIFEAGFEAGGGLAFVDALLPSEGDAWKLVEVKSGTRVRDYQRADLAIQVYIAGKAGVRLDAVCLAHVDSQWVYQGDGQYGGLLKETDLTAEARARCGEVDERISRATQVAGQADAPDIRTGAQCHAPFECSFIEHCQGQEPAPSFPVAWLPRMSGSLREHIKSVPVNDLRDLPDELLNEIQLRVKRHSLTGEPYFDSAGAAAALEPYPLPAVFLDFETVQFAVPIWKGYRPYQQIPFQFSAHRMAPDGTVSERCFLDLSGDDPSEPFAEALADTCDGGVPIFVYNAAFENRVIADLMDRLPEWRERLQSVKNRIVDLLPVARKHYYHPAQQGSWSIKRILPTISTDLDYQTLDGVQDGGLAMGAYLEAISSDTSPQRRAAIERQLLAYCRVDTLAMVRLWSVLAGRALPEP